MKKSKYKITVCGHFGGEKKFLDGQTVKTKNIYLALLDKYEKAEINIVDTYGWKRHPIKFLKKCVLSVKDSRNIIMLPARNGIKVFTPLYLVINKIYKRKIFYIVIGGWISDMLKTKRRLRRKIKKIDRIFVETNIMKNSLSELGINNVEILLNFKNIIPLKSSELKYNYEQPYKVCTFSRVIREKGIEDAINVIKKINEEANTVVYKLDIYGPIDREYEERFNKIITESPQYIQYKGCIDDDKSVEILKSYYLLLFPTRYRTEGIPGTIIDALFAGIPIIASKWDNVDEVIKDEENGFIFEFGNVTEFYNKLKLEIDKEKMMAMKHSCLQRAKNFTKETEMIKLYKNIEG